MTGQAFSIPVPAVIAVVVHEGRTLLVRRANPPDAGLWGFPGGRIELGETVTEAALRELAEETSVQGEALGVITTLDIVDRSDEGVLLHHFILIAVHCRWLSGEPMAGDDALEARWFAVDELDPHCLPMSVDVDILARDAQRRALQVRES